MNNIRHDAAKSLRGFAKFTVPALKAEFDAKKILSTEQHDNELARTLDQMAGIDGLLVTGEDWVFFYSSRIQFGKNYNSFTIRRSRPNGKATEYQKLTQAQSLQAPMPTYTIQTFINAEESKAVIGIIETIQLLRYLSKHADRQRTTASGETFYYCPWSELDDVKIYFVSADGRIKKEKPLD